MSTPGSKPRRAKRASRRKFPAEEKIRAHFDVPESTESAWGHILKS